MTMEDLLLEKAVEKKQKNKKKSNNINDKDKDEDNLKAKPKKKRSKKKAKSGNENEGSPGTISILGGGSDVFHFDEIASNKEASALIYDLVECFTCNFKLPEKELEAWNKTLFEKTVSVFTHILNNCVEKIFNKLINTYFFNRKNIVTKDASCQTEDDS